MIYAWRPKAVRNTWSPPRSAPEVLLRGLGFAKSGPADQSTSLAKAGAVQETGRDVAREFLQRTLKYCRVPVRFGVIEAVNGNIKALLRRGLGCTNLRHLLLKAQRLTTPENGIRRLPETRVNEQPFTFSFRAGNRSRRRSGLQQTWRCRHRMCETHQRARRRSRHPRRCALPAGR